MMPAGRFSHCAVISLQSANSNHDSLGCTFSRPLWPDAEEAALLSDEEEEVARAAAGGSSSRFGSVIGSAKLLGQQPGTGKPVWIKRGPFGLYLQLVSWIC
jgi:hypothetical protein